jgi:hypothetical protein
MTGAGPKPRALTTRPAQVLGTLQHHTHSRLTQTGDAKKKPRLSGVTRGGGWKSSVAMILASRPDRPLCAITQSFGCRLGSARHWRGTEASCLRKKAANQGGLSSEY